MGLFSKPVMISYILHITTAFLFFLHIYIQEDKKKNKIKFDNLY